MEKEEFIESQPFSDELVEKAWDRAEGNPEEAQELLGPSELTLKGHLSCSAENISGLYLITWNYKSNSIDNFRCSVINGSIEGFQLNTSHEDFLEKLRDLENSDQLMSGYTEELQENIRALWTSDEFDVSNTTDDEGFSELEETHRQLVGGLFDLNEFELEHNYEITRLINDNGEEQSDAEDEESLTVPSCDVRVTPVQGVSVTRLQPEDVIYVEIGEIPEEWSKLKPVLEDLRDESGLIPAQLRSKKHTDDGRLELEVQFGKKVYGSLSCGRDVSLMVPEETREKYGKIGTDGFDELFLSKYIFTALGVALALILFALFLI